MKIFAVALFVGLVALARTASTPAETQGACYSSVTDFCKGGDASKKGK